MHPEQVFRQTAIDAGAASALCCRPGRGSGRTGPGGPDGGGPGLIAAIVRRPGGTRPPRGPYPDVEQVPQMAFLARSADRNEA